MSKDSFENNGKKIKEIDQEKKNILFGGSFENNGENIKEIEEEKKGILFGDSVESISNEKWGVGIKKLLSGQDKNAALSVLFATIVLLLYFYFGIQDFCKIIPLCRKQIIGSIFIIILFRCFCSLLWELFLSSSS